MMYLSAKSKFELVVFELLNLTVLTIKDNSQY